MLFGVNKDCPIRITGIVGFNYSAIQGTADALIKDFGWKLHSEVKLVTSEGTVYSMILFNLDKV